MAQPDDGTAALIAALVVEQPGRFQFFHLDANLGKAEAVRRGVLQALGSSPDTVGFWDADLSTPRDDLPLFQQVLTQRGTALIAGSGARCISSSCTSYRYRLC